MNTCLNTKLVNRYVVNECTDNERKKVETHLTKCEICLKRVKSAQLELAEIQDGDQDLTGTKTFIGESDHSGGSMPEVSKSSYAPGEDDTSVKLKIEGYTILEQLPRGGQAVVYKAFQKATKRIVALKVLLQRVHDSKRAQYRFEREVDLAANLKHPNIVTIYDSGIAQGQYYYAMEYIEGKPLDKYIRLKELSTSEIMNLFNKICLAVAYAHQRGVMHRDLKPGNILVDDEGQPHILDFGLAKLTDSSEQVTPEAAVASIPGDVIGTLAFMSPEQASGQTDAIDIRTDVYSIGVILYRVLTNMYPYDISCSMLRILQNIQEIEPVRPSKLVHHLNSEVEAIVLMALAKEPRNRYQSAGELQRDIEYWLKGLPIAARSASSIYLLKKFIVRHRAVSVVTSLLLIIIVSTSFISLYFYSHARDALKHSQLKQEAYKAQAKRFMTFNQQLGLAAFLELWHDDKTVRARDFLPHLIKETRERIAAQFLLDPRPLSEKQEEFKVKLSSGESSFMAFVIGEYHLKNKNKAAAIESYKRCLEENQSPSELDHWFVNRATRQLNKLLNEDISVKTRPNDKTGE
jgi:serine/threonine protein kinase